MLFSAKDISSSLLDWTGPSTVFMSVALLLSVMFGPVQPRADDLTGEARVVDGDTLRIEGIRVRLHGIDAPETRQVCGPSEANWACGHIATLQLQEMTDGQPVTCKGSKQDRYGRKIAVCYVGDVDLNAHMVRSGWALAYRRYAKDYIGEEEQARAESRGMWRGPFDKPWSWRRGVRTAARE